MKKLKIKLPDKPSALIRLALKELKKIERLKTVRVDMDEAYVERPEHPSVEKPCVVCFAGAVMRGPIMKAGLTGAFFPSHFEVKDKKNKLLALDAFRSGNVESGLEYCRVPRNAIIKFCDNGRESFVEITPHGVSSADFHLEMSDLVKDLAKAGL